MKKVLQTLFDHKAAIILAFLASCLVAFPQVYFRIDHKDDGIYQGIELLPDSPWSARVREVMDGHPALGSIYYKDGKDDPYLFQPFGSIIVGYSGMALGLGINDTLLFGRVFFTFLAFILIYGFVFLVSRNTLVALSSASIILLAESFLHVYGLTELINLRSPDDFLRIGRPVYPALVYISYFSFLVSFWQWYTKRAWPWGILSTVLLAMNFYSYFYSWTYLYAFGGILGLFLIIRREWADAFRVVGVYIGAVILAIPYWLNMYRATHHPVYEEAGLRFGVIESHTPLFVGIVVIVALAVFLLRFPKEDRRTYFFGLALMLAPFVTLNQQILTGKVLQEAHYHWFFHKPMAIIFILIVTFYLLNRRGLTNYTKILAGLILVGSFGVGVFVQGYSYAYGFREGGEFAIDRQKYGPVMEWLSQHAAPESMVFANDTTSHMIVLYTPLNVFYHRAAIYSLAAPKERLLDVVFAFYRLRGVGAEDAPKVFGEERGFLSTSIYGMHYRELRGSYDTIPDDKVSEIVTAYQKTSSTPTPAWLEATWKKYDVEYVVWDTKSDPAWQLEKYTFLEQVAVFGDLTVYKVVES